VLPARWLVPAKLAGQFMTRTMIDLYEADAKALGAKLDRLAGLSDAELLEENQAASWLGERKYSSEAVKRALGGEPGFMTTTIFIPISHRDHLERVFHAPRGVAVRPGQGQPADLRRWAGRSLPGRAPFTEASRFDQRLCVQRPQAGRATREYDIQGRRRRIAELQNEAKPYLRDCDYIFGLEDDKIPPSHALARRQHDYGLYPYAGFIEGVELGRCGISHVGAWRADDVYEPTKAESCMPPAETSERVEPIDAGSFYCYLTKASTFLAHHYAPFGRRSAPTWRTAWRCGRGFVNYLDWSVRCAHYRQDGTSVELGNAPPVQARLTLEGERWRQEVVPWRDQSRHIG
jgi:hypothetical protein